MVPVVRAVVAALGLVLVVLLFGVAPARAARPNDCSGLERYLEAENATGPRLKGPGPVCGGMCCDSNTEKFLMQQVKKDYASLLRHTSMSLKGVLDTTAATFREHLEELTRQSENKTLQLFSTVYRRMAVWSRQPISSLYQDIRQYVVEGFDPPNMHTSANRFFVDLFPLVYHHAVHAETHDFVHDYKQCLRDSVPDIQPFGTVPQEVAASLQRFLEATRLLLEALGVGVDVLSATDELLEPDDATGEACHIALMKMTHCSKCNGYLAEQVMPCGGYCLNVLRGCLTRTAAQLASPWNGYVEVVKRLGSICRNQLHADTTIRSLEQKISEAIMHAMEHGPELEKKVKHKCGPAKLSDKEEPAVDSYWQSSSRPTRVANGILRISTAPPPDTELLHLVSEIEKSRGFYGNLADSVCKDENFAEDTDTRCWTGDKIGDYTKTVVGTDVASQKYNPEISQSNLVPSQASLVTKLAEKLDYVKRKVTMSLGALNPNDSDGDMQGDAAEASGSGDYDPEGSGSGDGGVDSDGKTVDDHKTMDGNKNHKTSTASITFLSTSWIMICISTLLLNQQIV